MKTSAIRISPLLRLMLLILFSKLLTPPAGAQVLPFHSLSVKDGLVSNYILCLEQDRTGRLWIGTPEGASVFDGMTFTNFSTKQGLPQGSVTSILEDPKRGGVILVGTTGGLSEIVSGVVRLVPNTDPNASWINDIRSSPDGTVWVGAGGGVYRYHSGTLEAAPLPDRARGALELTITADGMVWILNQFGVHRYDPVSRRTHTIDSSSGVYFGANSMMHDNRGDVFVCSRDSSILHLSGNVLKEKIRVAGVQPMFIVQDNHGNYWVGTSNGLFACAGGKPDPSNAVRYSTENGLPASALNVCLFDSERNLWFGTEGRGVTRLEDWHIAMFQDIDITGLGIYDKRGHLWLTSMDGIWEYRATGQMKWVRTLHRRTRAWPGSYPYAMVLDGKGRLIVAFASGAFARFDISDMNGKGFGLPDPEIIAPAGEIPSPDSFTLCMDRKERLWCNFGKGHVAAVTMNGRGRILKSFPGLGPDIRKIYEDLYGRIWIGGYNSGISIIDANDLNSAKVRRIEALDGISTRAFHMDRRGRMWIGTLLDGVIVVDKDSIIRYSDRDGLPSNKIYSITEDLDGTIWLGTQKGMAYARGGTLPFRRNLELTDSPVYSCGVRRDGLLFIASRYMLTLFNVPKSSRDTIPPVVQITSMLVNGRSIDLDRPIELGASENNCRIEFSAIRLRRPRDIRYQYLLEGVDSSWSAPTRERSLTLAALRPGLYTLLVRAVNGDAVVSREPARVQFTVRRPYWQQWWFILLSVVVVGLIMFGVIRGRVRRLLEIERIRARIAADLHDDIGSGLTRIALMTEVMQRQVQALGRMEKPDTTLLWEIGASMLRVGSISRELVEGMSDVVWSIDPRNDSLEKLIDRVRVYALDVCESKDIDFRLEKPDELGRYPTSSDISRCALLVSKEAINNAARHSGASSISMRVSFIDRQLRIVIEDNGKGFEMDELSRINGLTNMRSRVEKAGGAFSVDSAKGAGSRIGAAIPLRE